MSFYKTNSPEVLKAFDHHYAERKILLDACDNFSLLFKEDDIEVKVFYQQCVNQCKFGGLKFMPFKNHPSWTKPYRKNGQQRLRANLKKSTKEQRDAHKILLKMWADNVPKQKASYDPIFESVGTDWGEIIFSGGFQFFKYLDFAYVKTSIVLNETVTEILGSEFDQAQNNYRDSKK